MSGFVGGATQAYPSIQNAVYYGKVIDPKGFTVDYNTFEHVRPLDRKYINYTYVQFSDTFYYDNNAVGSGWARNSENYVADADFLLNYNTEMYLRLLNYDSPMAEKAREVSRSLAVEDFSGIGEQEVYNTIHKRYEEAFGDDFYLMSNPIYFVGGQERYGWTTVNMWFDSDVRTYTSGDAADMRRIAEYGDIKGAVLKEAIYAKYGDLRNIARYELQGLAQELSEYNLISEKEALCLALPEGVTQYSPPGSAQRNIVKSPYDRINILDALNVGANKVRLTEYETIYDALIKEMLRRYTMD